MSNIPLNKFGKRDLVIGLHSKGHIYMDIAHIAHISVRDIKPIIKEYERKKRLETKKEENNQSNQKTTKKLSLSSRAFILYQEGKKIWGQSFTRYPFKTAMRYWVQYLKSIRMFESFEFYKDYQYDIPILFSIATFIKRNNVFGKDIANVLMEAKTTANLQLHFSILKNDIEKLQKTKNNYLLNQNSMNNHHQLPPLGPLPRYYNW